MKIKKTIKPISIPNIPSVFLVMIFYDCLVRIRKLIFLYISFYFPYEERAELAAVR